MKKQRAARVAPAIRLDVTERDIANGIRGLASHCMIAQAVLRYNNQATYIKCSTSEIAWSDPTTGMRRRYFNPPVGAMNAAKFDQGDESIKPFRLSLNEGIEFPIGWRAKHPGSKGKRKIYKRTGRKASFRYTKRRLFGACVLRDSATLAHAKQG